MKLLQRTPLIPQRRQSYAFVTALLTACCLHTANSVADYENASMTQYSDEVFLRLVEKYAVDAGEHVDYAAWKNSPEDLRALQAQVEKIAIISPTTHPELFTRPADKKRYFINTYNTLVVAAVLEYWPLDSVKDVKLSLTSRLIPGKGFFYDREVIVGGEKTSLLKFEKALLKHQADPRLHFALNCASGSCPVLRPSNWSDAELDLAAREFINNSDNVRVEDDTVYLSRIFKWYKKDFPRDIYDYLQQYADAPLSDQLAVAAAEKFRKRYPDYDWSLNDGSDADLFE